MGGTSASPRLAFIALDACDAGLMVELARGGLAPNVASLLDSGAVVDTIAPFGTFVGSSWMTISTGADVGTHRYWNWAEVDRETYAIRATSPRESRVPPFWGHLSDAGQRVAVLDVPHADVPERFNGVLVKEWGCHDRHHGTGCYPAELLDELEASTGAHPVGTVIHPDHPDAFAPCDYVFRGGHHRSRDEERELHLSLREGLVRKRDLSLAVLEREPWDLFMSVMGESHCVGHQLWHVHDESHPRHDPATRALIGDPVVDVYHRLDAAIGDHLERLGPDTTVWLQMNHGMGPHYDGDHILDEVLVRLDPRAAGIHRGGRASSMVRTVLDALPERGRKAALAAAGRAVRRRADVSPPPWSGSTPPDPSRSWFRIPGNTTVAPIRLNVVGREPQGVLHPGPELDDAVAQLIDDLGALINLDTGRPAVRAVVRADEVLERSDDDALPDLFVEWDRGAPIERLWSPATGTIAARYDHWRTGDHNDRGLVVVRGPGIEPGHRVEPMSLVDVAPTVCAVLGAPLTTTDGRVHEDLLPSGAASEGRRPAAFVPEGPSHRLGRDTPLRAGPDTGAVASGALDLAADASRRAREVEARLNGETARADALATELDGLRRHLGDVDRHLGTLLREREVWTTMAWLEVEPVVDGPLVSVVMPTHERPDLLRKAIDSVIAQRYPNWELVVVDDGSDAGKSVVADVDDERITYVSIPHGGPCRARNEGLDRASGELIAYLDDDNVLHPGWLHAVAWAFGARPDHRVLYGARLNDDFDRVHGLATGGLPWLQFERWDRERLERSNLADIGVIAHRAGAPGARFDESFWECGDWDFLLSITEDHTPLELPAVAFSYRSDTADRLTGQYVDHEQAVRDKWAAKHRR